MSRQLEPELRKQLLAPVDGMSAYTEQVSLESFIAGFRVAQALPENWQGSGTPTITTRNSGCIRVLRKERKKQHDRYESSNDQAAGEI